MNVHEAESFFQQLQLGDDGLSVSVGISQGKAYLRTECENRWAVAQTRGAGWFAVDTDLGFSWNRFDEDASALEIEKSMKLIVDIARAYAQGCYAISRSRLLRIPELRIDLEAEVVVLNLGLPDLLKRIPRL